MLSLWNENWTRKNASERNDAASSCQFQPNFLCFFFLATPCVETSLRDGPASCWRPPRLTPAPRFQSEVSGSGGPVPARKQPSMREAERPTSAQFSSSSGGTGPERSRRSRTRSACGGTAPAGPPGMGSVYGPCRSGSPLFCTL